MTDEVTPDVQEVLPTPESSPESVQPTEIVEEPVDENGVPLKNRIAEKERKLRSQLSQLEAQEALLKQPTPEVQTPGNQEEAIRLVKEIADRATSERLAPIIAKQFLLENPDAVEMVEDINRVRALYPELSSVDKLEVAYRLAKAEKADEQIRQATEQGRKEAAKALETQNQAAIEGAGKVSKPPESLDERIQGAKTLAELEQLAAAIK